MFYHNTLESLVRNSQRHSVRSARCGQPSGGSTVVYAYRQETRVTRHLSDMLRQLADQYTVRVRAGDVVYDVTTGPRSTWDARQCPTTRDNVRVEVVVHA